jgi:hypothetical protein
MVWCWMVKKFALDIPEGIPICNPHPFMLIKYMTSPLLLTGKLSRRTALHDIKNWITFLSVWTNNIHNYQRDVAAELEANIWD